MKQDIEFAKRWYMRAAGKSFVSCKSWDMGTYALCYSARQQAGDEPIDGDEAQWEQAGKYGTTDASGREG